MITLYRPELNRLALHEIVALVVFQRGLIAVLLTRPAGEFSEGDRRA